MKYCELGKTGIKVSSIGLGTVKWGRTESLRYPHAFELPDDRTLLSLLGCAKELGINLLDTAPAYGHSEERLGKLLQENRHEWIVCTKVGEEFVNGHSFFDFTPEGMESSIDRSIKRLKTDYLDIVLVHSNGEDIKIIENGVFDSLANLKKAGKIRAYGMSTKTKAGGLKATMLSDVVMVTYNPIEQEDQVVISAALNQNKGILIKKALMSGHLDQLNQDDPVSHTMQFIFKEPGVHSVVVGTINPEHLTYNVNCAKKIWKFS